MKEIKKRIENVINMTNDMIKIHPLNPMFTIMLRNLEALMAEFSKSDLDKEKISSLHYGFLRATEEVVDFENTPFGKEVEKLLLELNKY